MQLRRQKQYELFSRGLCLYCGMPADSRDHVPPRCLLEKPYPNNLYTVGSCKKCNLSFAIDEEYFLAAMSHVGFTETLQKKVESGGKVDRALSRSAVFDRLIESSLIVEGDNEITFAPDLVRLENVVQKVVRGLYFKRYGRLLKRTDLRDTGIFHFKQLPPKLVAQIVTERFRFKKWTVVQEGIFEYLFVRWSRFQDARLLCILNFHSTLWGVAACPWPNSKSNLRIA